MKKAILINDKNKEKIETALKEGQKRARERKIESYDELEEKLEKFKSDECIGKEVIMGIRPENISDSKETIAKFPDATIKCHVEVVELMGSETYLYLSTTGKDGNIIARVDPRSTSRTNDDIKVAFDTSRLHFFDKDSETTLLKR